MNGHKITVDITSTGQCIYIGFQNNIDNAELQRSELISAIYFFSKPLLNLCIGAIPMTTLKEHMGFLVFNIFWDFMDANTRNYPFCIVTKGKFWHQYYQVRPHWRWSSTFAKKAWTYGHMWAFLISSSKLGIYFFKVRLFCEVLLKLVLGTVQRCAVIWKSV